MNRGEVAVADPRWSQPRWWRRAKEMKRGGVVATADGTPGYGLDNAWRKALARLRSLEEWLDPGTIRHLRAAGVGAGWRCLEVGAGAGSIARWLSGAVGPDGEVLATDIDTRFLGTAPAPNLRVQRHDITADDLPDAPFDLVHCRLVLAHLPGRQAVLRKLAAALKPLGQLVAEEMDFVSVSADERQPGGPAFNQSVATSNDVLRGRGFDPEYGRQLLSDLRAAGLADIGTEGRVRLWPGGSAAASAWRLTFEQLQPDMTARGLEPATIAAAIRACQDPRFAFMSQVTMAAWGQRK
jgi:SAM-dependent methyltransferase